MTVVENGVVSAIGLDDVVQRLGHEHRLDPVTAHQAQGLLEEGEAAQQGELVHEHQQMSLLLAAGVVRRLMRGQGLGRRIEQQAHQRFQGDRVGRSDLDVEGDRGVGAHQIAEREVGSGKGMLQVVAGQPFEIAARRPLHGGPETVVHGGVTLDRRRHERMDLGFARTPYVMEGADHDIGGRVQVGQHPSYSQKGLVRIGGCVEDVQDHGLHDLGRRLVPDRFIVSGAARVAEDGDQPLHLGQLLGAGSYLGHRVEAGRAGVPGIEEQAMAVG